MYVNKKFSELNNLLRNDVNAVLELPPSNFICLSLCEILID